MTKSIIIAGVLLCVFLNQMTLARVQVKNATLKQVLVFRSNQDAIRGKLVEIDEEYVLVLSSEREVKIPFTEISRILLSFERGPSMGPLYGAVLGGYSSAFIYMAARDRGGFVESQNLGWYALVVVPSIALGAGIGYLVDPGSGEKEEVFDFTGDDEANAREKSRLISRATHDARGSKVHITLQGSHINSNMPGINLPGGSSYDYNSLSKFRLLRKVQATYSFVPEAEAGVAMVWFSEPPQSSYGYEVVANSYTKSYNVFQSFDATGKYIVALYRPLYHLLNSRLDVKVGGGIGTASVEYTRSTTVVTNAQSGPGPEQFSLFKISDNVLAGYLFGQVEFEPVDGLSVGLVADKVFGPSKDAPSVPEANIPAQTLFLDNTSLGFTISLHF